MKLLYKALASVSMILLSTAAAVGVRRIAVASKNRQQELEKTEVPLDKAKIKSGDKEIVTFAGEGNEQDFSQDFDVIQDDISDMHEAKTPTDT